MATHCSILAWEIPWIEESGRLHTPHGLTKNWVPLSSLTLSNVTTLLALGKY